MSIKTILALGITMVVLQAHALTISPGSELISRNDPNNTEAIITWINANTTYVIGTAAYKKDAEPEDEEGSIWVPRHVNCSLKGANSENHSSHPPRTPLALTSTFPIPTNACF